MVIVRAGRDATRRIALPTYRAMERKVRYPASAAASGNALPSIVITQAYVSVCGASDGVVKEWEARRWQQHRADEQSRATDRDDGPGEPAAKTRTIAEPLVDDDPRRVGWFELVGRIGTGAMGLV